MIRNEIFIHEKREIQQFEKQTRCPSKKEAKYRISESDPRSQLVHNKVNRNFYSGRNPCYSKKLLPIDRSVNEINLKSHRILTQIATENKILSHKLETEAYSSLKVLEFFFLPNGPHNSPNNTHPKRLDRLFPSCVETAIKQFK